MVGLYKPKVLLIKSSEGEYLEKILSSNDTISLFTAKNLNEAKTQLNQANIDAIVVIMNKKENILAGLSHNIPIIVVEDGTGGLVPKEWREEGNIFLRKKTAKENLVKIFFDLLEQKKQLRNAA